MTMLSLRVLLLLALAGLGRGADQSKSGISDKDKWTEPLRSSQDPERNSVQKLRGRFLHMTDLHPDPYYREGTKESTMCHGKRRKKKHRTHGDAAASIKQRRAGHWGLDVSECDSPFELIDMTFQYLKDHWADHFDFIVWTGDNARHDNDNQLPRSMKSINELNRYISDQFLSTFGKNIPIIPSIGNNDIYPHNLMSAGPNEITNSFVRLWKHYIPEEQYHLFQRGAYFAVEVIKDTLAVISLNTLYFYDSNKIVDGCEKRSEPGTLEMEWLEVQLNSYRQRNMQVYLTGHVPPSSNNYSPTCYASYRKLSLQFQDTIIGHFYGHMNVDHYYWIQDENLDDTFNTGLSRTQGTVSSTKNLAEELVDMFTSVPVPKKIDLSDYAIIHVNPSIVPTFYPSLRIWEYNVTASSAFIQQPIKSASHDPITDNSLQAQPTVLASSQPWILSDYLRPTNMIAWLIASKKLKPRSFKNSRHTSAESPSRTNRFLSPLGYTQMYFDLRKGNKNYRHGHYSTDRLGGKYRQPSSQQGFVASTTRWNVEYRTNSSGPGEYGLEDGTIGSWIKLGRKIGADAQKLRKGEMSSKHNLWRAFISRMYVKSAGSSQDQYTLEAA